MFCSVHDWHSVLWINKHPKRISQIDNSEFPASIHEIKSLLSNSARKSSNSLIFMPLQRQFLAKLYIFLCDSVYTWRIARTSQVAKKEHFKNTRMSKLSDPIFSFSKGVHLMHKIWKYPTAQNTFYHPLHDFLSDSL